MMDLRQLIPIGGVAATVVLVAAIVALIGILGVWKLVKDRRSGFPPQDERTRKITGKAAQYSLIIGVYFMLGLTWVLFFGKMLLGYAVLEAMPALIISVLVLILSFIGLRWYLGRKGDL